MEKLDFEVAIDRGRKLLRLTLHGFWDTSTVDRYRTESKNAISQLLAQGCVGDKLLILIDRRGHPPQSQEVANAMRDVVASNSAEANRSAVLVDGALNKFQTDRIRSGRGRVFTSESEAMAWLFADDLKL